MKKITLNILLLLSLMQSVCIGQKNIDLLKLNLKKYDKLNYFLDIRYQPSSLLNKSYTPENIKSLIEGHFRINSINIVETDNRHNYPILEIITFPNLVTEGNGLIISQTDFRIYDKIDGNVVLMYYTSWDCYSHDNIVERLWKILGDNMNAFIDAWKATH